MDQEYLVEESSLTASTVGTAALLLRRVEAMGRLIVRRASGVAFTTSFGASVAGTTMALLRSVTISVTASKAQTVDGHRGELVWLPFSLGSNMRSARQEGDGSNSAEVHLDDFACG